MPSHKDEFWQIIIRNTVLPLQLNLSDLHLICVHSENQQGVQMLHQDFTYKIKDCGSVSDSSVELLPPMWLPARDI